ncbi:RraA family protein [Devosia sp. LjRoot3]|jgi:regulator of RNase E activity RraA|uniref:RraA family protein n=1 Tax=Devosia sp. LjRoot3 TaxID=3342319 RepID=UPI003ECE58DF
MPRYLISDSMPPPVPVELLAKLADVETATAGHLRDTGFMDGTLRPLWPGGRIVGSAVTVSISGTDSTLLHHVTGLLRPGDFVVVDRLGDSRYACWGGGVTNAAKCAGAVGAVVDGPATDPEEIERFGLPVWSRGISAITTRLANLGGSFNYPVSCGGVPVHPGDIVMADESGILVLPREGAEAFADQCLIAQDKGIERIRRVRDGEKLGDVSGASLMVRKALAAK